MTNQMICSSLSRDPAANAKITLCTFHKGYILHRHTFFEIAFVLSGSCRHILNGKSSHFKKGDICLLSPASIHQFMEYENAEPATIFTLSFSPKIISKNFWSIIPIFNFPATAHLSEDAFTSVKYCFERLLKHGTSESLPLDTYTVTGIQWIIMSMVDSVNDMDSGIAKILPAIIFIQNHFSDPISLDETAETVHFSPEHFSRTFHQAMGVSYQNYLLRLRLDFAATALSLQENLSINEVAVISGFRTCSYFSRAFKQSYGCSPENFRKLNSSK